jgi:cytochrome c biogenesis protein CcmG, thiol:disulfide interchange protein DsbE
MCLPRRVPHDSADQSPGQPSLEAAPGAGRRRPLFLGILIGLSVITLGSAVWQWQQDRQLLAQQSRPAPPRVAALAPEFKLMSPDGMPMNLSDLRGKVVLLNFWATWCPPCRAEMPELNALYRRYGNEKDFVVVGVDLQERSEEVASFARQNDITFPLLVDHDGRVTGQDYRIRSLPASVIVDREGRIRDSWSGPLRREAMLARLEKVW